ncbi:MAG: tRNA (adenosine(37)-N6)-threonylcarbamoyltransferase complex dimerization subunit type 1 TsaB [Eubacterium sp.]|nr:tRNA (adenosine(37)-N6)-threonylcarbamoyltransferase complex dimerization subunit type 1 TsaB [Eubacterium sp.]
MKILAIDSSGVTAGVAIVEDNILAAEYTVDYKKTHSQTLLPMIMEISKMVELDLDSLDAIGIAKGPGSFTGLRIGAATAKGLALALDVPIVPVPTVDALAFNLWGSSGVVCPLMNARRSQTYTGLYRFNGGEMETVIPQFVTSVDDIIARVVENGEPVTFLGDGISEFMSTIQEKCFVEYRIAPAHMCRQRAGSVGVLAGRMLESGESVFGDDFSPIYLRLSQAERERLEKEGKVPSGADS